MSDSGLNSRTFRLFKHRNANPFIDGMASIMFIPTSDELYNFDDSEGAADKNSILSDWEQVGDDLRQEMIRYDEEEK